MRVKIVAICDEHSDLREKPALKVPHSHVHRVSRGPKHVYSSKITTAQRLNTNMEELDIVIIIYAYTHNIHNG